MSLVPHKITALAESDAQGTDGKNIIAGAVVSMFDINGDAVILYDDENGANGSTAKQTDAKGQVVVYVTAGEYDEEVNGATRRRVYVGGNNVTSYATTASLEASRPNKTGQRAENRERDYAQYTLMPHPYTPIVGDVAAANGRVWSLVTIGDLNIKQFGVVGDGTTAASSIINSVASAFFGRSIYFPKGTYVIDSTIAISSVGLGNAQVSPFYGDGIGETIFDNRTGGACISYTSGTAAEFGYGAVISDLTIDNTTSVSDTIGIVMNGNRFAKIKNIEIINQGSHGIYGESALGDFTDNAQLIMEHVQVESCGGYGIFFDSATGGIQYATNMYQVRVGRNALGGIKLGGSTNTEIKHSSTYYNGGVGIELETALDTSRSKLVVIENVESDTNEGEQIVISRANTVVINSPYLIANAGASTSYTKGIVIKGDCSGVYINEAYPRYNPALTGLTTIEVEAGATDVVISNTSYQGFSASNGQQYNLLESSVVVDDVSSRVSQSNGTFTAQIKNLDGSVVSPTTVEGFYSVNGKSVTVSFRNLTDIDLSGFSGLDILKIDVPFASIIGDGGGFVGQSIVTGLVGETQIAPTIGNGGGSILLYSMTSGSLITADKLTSGSSDILFLTLTYMR